MAKLILIGILLILSCGKTTSGALDAENIWIDDYSVALTMSQETGKPILINFTGSDWCVWCMRLAEEVFNQAAFLRFAEENLILLMIDFPRNIKQPDEVVNNNRVLAQRYNIAGFPTIFIIDKDEEVIATTGYRPGGVEAYIQHLEGMIVDSSP